MRSSSLVVRSASPPPAPSAASLPTLITPTHTCSPAPSVLSFTLGGHVDRRSNSPHPLPSGDLPVPPNVTHHTNTSTASIYTPSIAPKELSNPAPTSRKYTGTTISLPLPVASGSGAPAGASLSPTSPRLRQASTSSDPPTPTTPPTVQAPFSQTLATQWTVPQVIAWLQPNGFDSDIQHAFQENDTTGDVLIELGGPELKDELGVTAFGKRMRLLKQFGELKREDEKAKQQETEKSIIGSRWSGSSRPASAIGDDEDQLKVKPTRARPTSLVLSPSDGALATRGFWDSVRGNKDGRGVLSEGESSRKPDITKAKQLFNHNDHDQDSLLLMSVQETKIKGYVNITGYKVIADENANPGRYGSFLLVQGAGCCLFVGEGPYEGHHIEKLQRSHPLVVQRPDDPHCHCPTNESRTSTAISLGARSRPTSLSNGPPLRNLADQHSMNSFFVENGQEPVFESAGKFDTVGTATGTGGFSGSTGYNQSGTFSRASLAEMEQPMSPILNAAPTRPPHEMRPRVSKSASTSALSAGEQELVDWVNSKLLPTCPLAEDLAASMLSGLVLLHLAKSIKETDSGASDSVFPQGPGDDRLDGLFKLFDFLLDNDLRIGAVSINDVRNGNTEKIAQLVRALKSWDEKRRASGITKSSVATGPWMGMSSY
ncbi:unnamed protein product [Rhizoctonia solani]|uniref:SAM domain-containing protein n=1 Tax=Rhizoctonia solani TaxID=456999 RepID=A0A8H2XK87_9AGAM|nr:unnamed protein product [Rhizoctonia solani]